MSTRQPKQSPYEQGDLLNEAGDLRTGPSWERTDLVLRSKGFIPSTFPELDDAAELVKREYEQRNSVPRYLGNITVHQEGTRSKNPTNASISIVTTWGRYRSKSINDINHLAELRAELSGVHPRSIREIASATGTDGLGQLARYMDLRHFFDTGEQPKQDELLFKRIQKHREGDVYTSSILDQVRSYVIERCEEVPPNEILTTLNGALGDQVARRNFWTGAIEDAVAYMPTTSVALKLLGRVSVHRNE